MTATTCYGVLGTRTSWQRPRTGSGFPRLPGRSTTGTGIIDDFYLILIWKLALHLIKIDISSFQGFLQVMLHPFKILDNKVFFSIRTSDPPLLESIVNVVKSKR